MRTEAEHRMFVAWRAPDQGGIVPVGVLVVRPQSGHAARYQFSYLRGALTAPGFRPLPSFPDLRKVYRSNSLFPLFVNRMMPRDRPDYPDFLQQLDLQPGTDPFVVLAESGGRKATDRIEIFPEPFVDPSSGRLSSRFFARGIRHIPGAEAAVAALRPGDQLTLFEETTNRHNPRALLMHGPTGRVVGYVPDYLVDLLHDLRRTCGDEDVRVEVAHVNPPGTSSHMRLLCRLNACMPGGFEPFSAQEFQPISHALLTR